MLTLFPPGVVKRFPSALIPRLIMKGILGVFGAVSFDVSGEVSFDVSDTVPFDVSGAVSSDNIFSQVTVGKQYKRQRWGRMKQMAVWYGVLWCSEGRKREIV